MKSVLFVLIVAISFVACKQQVAVTAPKTEDKLSSSIFLLNSDWQNQDAKILKMNDLKGKTLVVVMIYTTCKAACPILVASMRKIESQVSVKNLDKTSFVLVSIDPKTDIPSRLKTFAEQNKMTATQWVFLTSNEYNTQEFANVLSMKYKKISPMDFSHSNIISVFAPDGTMQFQEEGLQINTEKIAGKVDEIVENYK